MLDQSTGYFGYALLTIFKLTIKDLTLYLNLVNRVPLFMILRKSCPLGCKLFYN